MLFGVLSVTPGASSVTRNGVRPIGSVAICADRIVTPPREVTGAGVAPRTSTTSLTGASASS